MDVAVTKFEVVSLHSSGKTDGNHDKPHKPKYLVDRMSDVRYCMSGRFGKGEVSVTAMNPATALSLH